MEKELNIAAILKDKPKGTKLWSPIVGNCTFSGISSKNGAIVASFVDKDGEQLDWDFNEYGKTLSAPKEAEVCLFPSNEMRDWEKFAWKKGDVLCSNTGDSCIFVKWISDDYTSFLGYYSTHNDYEKEECQTAVWSKKTSKEDIEQYILAIEAIKNGTLNLETLGVEQPKQEFKDGDIIFNEGNRNYSSAIGIVKKDKYGSLMWNVLLTQGKLYCKSDSYIFLSCRLATDSEKQQLFDALEKENKVWDEDKKMLVDLPKKCELKPFDKVLVRDTDAGVWMPTLFGFYDNEFCNYVCLNDVFQKCIPYNDQTAHLLGTTDEWKGGEG